MSASNEIARRRGRSHPPSLIRLAERLIEDEHLIAPGDVVLCACSGGPDSTALLSVLAHLRRRFRFDLVAHGIDHGLRAEGGEELGHAGRAAGALRVPFATTRIHVAAGGNVQARARSARLAALRAAARLAGARLLATGHTADDRAETFLLRLLRGAGPRGLAVLPPSAPLPTQGAARRNRGSAAEAGPGNAPTTSAAPQTPETTSSETPPRDPQLPDTNSSETPPRDPQLPDTNSSETPPRDPQLPDTNSSETPPRDPQLPDTNSSETPPRDPQLPDTNSSETLSSAPITLIRPLLRARRADVEAHLARHHLTVARDPSNLDARFLRVRVRNELLPLLESLSPGIAEHLCALADMLAAPAEDDLLAAAPAGDELPALGRAQRLAIARAKKCERPVNLRLPGGREVTVAFSEGRPVLMEPLSPRTPRREGP